MSIHATRPTADLDELLAINGGLVGASTGFLEDLRGDWPAMVEASSLISHQAIELSALSGDELPGLERYLRTADLGAFRRISVHGPSKGWSSTPSALARTLRDLEGPVAGIVMHPETLGDPCAFADLGERVWLENMDTRKRDARTVAELERYFDLLPSARFCFDVAHAWLHDPSMELAHALLDAFGDRLAEVHLSSILPSGRHIPLQRRVLSAFAPVLRRCTGVAWILEAPLPV
jgi:hypothetical protein